MSDIVNEVDGTEEGDQGPHPTAPFPSNAPGRRRGGGLAAGAAAATIVSAAIGRR